ncbi:hypothetical protein DDZ18_02740 [Marinicauda salina]|uniref:Histidine phosphatase family protein n=1 Tax=Marinicauda salina TaxID=2135793 RepID=A0A2U2BX38_9PROT|nr:phosphoglycerate mutase family protein [Marinicauda salina]PWE18539.1 hypothetical protein DDZ18_02740 [Marinicauda salina]
MLTLAIAAALMSNEPAAPERQVLVVRHARKISEDCNALDCPLSERGEAMVARLGTFLAGPDVGGVDAARASSACRTVRTAEAAGVPVIPHQAGPDHVARCGGGVDVALTREDAIDAVRADDAPATLVAEHSNTVCLWIVEYAGEAAAGEAGCVDGRLPSEAYGDVFRLSGAGEVWTLTVFEDAFDVAGE